MKAAHEPRTLSLYQIVVRAGAGGGAQLRGNVGASRGRVQMMVRIYYVCKQRRTVMRKALRHH